MRREKSPETCTFPSPCPHNTDVHISALSEQIKRCQFAFRAVTYSVRSDSGAGWKANRNELEFELCHSIVVCARLPRWVANGMCSSALSGLNCSRNAANGNRATGSPAFARPRGMRKPKREGPRTDGEMAQGIPLFARFAPGPLDLLWFDCKNFWRRRVWRRGGRVKRSFWRGGWR